MNGWPALLGVLARALTMFALREMRDAGTPDRGERSGRVGADGWTRHFGVGRSDSRAGRVGPGGESAFDHGGDRAKEVGQGGGRTTRVGRGPRLVGLVAGGLIGSVPAGLAPSRIGTLVLVGAAAFGFVMPDLIRARIERRRHRRMVAALPDALDLLAVSVASGRGLAGSLADLAASGRGPLVDELSTAGEDMAWGASQEAALEALRARIGGPEIGAFCATLERSRRLGSPLADQLRRQSSLLREDQRRSIEEDAARAAPKIQLVIALILVPSVLLLIVAALIANVDTLLPTTTL